MAAAAFGVGMAGWECVLGSKSFAVVLGRGAVGGRGIAGRL